MSEDRYPNVGDMLFVCTGTGDEINRTMAKRNSCYRPAVVLDVAPARTHPAVCVGTEPIVDLWVFTEEGGCVQLGTPREPKPKFTTTVGHWRWPE